MGKPLSKYEKAIAAGELYLVRNRLMERYTQWRSYGNSFSSDDDYKAHILAFHATQPRLTVETITTYQRYECEGSSAYWNAVEGGQYYLVLKPSKKAPDEVSVVACFLCETTPLTPALEAALQRDLSRTGFPVSLQEEQAQRNGIIAQLQESRAVQRRKDETPAEKACRLQTEKDQELFSEITNQVLIKGGLFCLMPLVLLGCVLLLLEFPLLGLACIFGGGLLFLLLALLLIAMKKPLIARKKRKMHRN